MEAGTTKGHGHPLVRTKLTTHSFYLTPPRLLLLLHFSLSEKDFYWNQKIASAANTRPKCVIAFQSQSPSNFTCTIIIFPPPPPPSKILLLVLHTKHLAWAQNPINPQLIFFWITLETTTWKHWHWHWHHLPRLINYISLKEDIIIIIEVVQRRNSQLNLTISQLLFFQEYKSSALISNPHPYYSLLMYIYTHTQTETLIVRHAKSMWTNIYIQWISKKHVHKNSPHLNTRQRGWLNTSD